MNQMIVTKGKLLGIGLKKHAKMRKGNSSLGYFDLNGKTIIPYNLKHYLRLTTKISPSLIQITPKKVPNVQMVYSEQRGTGTQIPVSAPSSLRSKLEKRLQSSYGTSGRKAFEGYASEGSCQLPAFETFGSEHKAFELP